MTMPSGADHLEFEKARLQYLMATYEKEVSRKDILEKKAQFYITFVGVFLTGIFLKLDYVAAIAAAWPGKGGWTPARAVLFGSVAVIGVSLIVVIISSLEVVRATSYATEAPENASTLLFDKSHALISDRNPERFIADVALVYARALDGVSGGLARKGRLLKVAAGGLVMLLLGAILFIGSVSIVPTHIGGSDVEGKKESAQARQGKEAEAGRAGQH